jgi:hypothetical protein
VEIETASALNGANWTSLVYGVEHGACTLMLGPNAVTGTYDGESLPVHVAMARFVKQQLGAAGAHLDASRPWSVAQAAVAEQDGLTLRAWVEEFSLQFCIDDEVLRALASMPFPLVINTSPGGFVERVFRAIKPSTYGDFYDRTAPARLDAPDPTVDAPVVYQLYGSLERPPSLILSENDRLDFVEAVISGRPGLPLKLKNLLSDEERPFLFLGFELGQWQLQLLLHVLGRNKTRAYKSFALEGAGDEIDEATQDFYLRGQKIRFVSGSMSEFVSELRSRVRTEAPEQGPVGARMDEPPPLPPDAPVVFICHASEDRAAAERISSELESNGVGTWLDRNELTGGDEWNTMIKRTISEVVDYVVVLQSANLLAKTRGYVNREINLAIDRQSEYRPPGRFVIPAFIDDPGSALEILGQWQSIDLRTGVDALVRAIRRDEDKRDRTSR